MDSYDEKSEAELRGGAKDVRNVCSTGKNQVKVLCDRKKKKSAANSKVFCVCMLCTLVYRDFGEVEGFLFCATKEYMVMLPHWGERLSPKCPSFIF